MKKLFIAAIISIVLSIELANDIQIKNRHIVPVIYEIENIPNYFRKKPARFVPFNELLQNYHSFQHSH